MSTRKRSRKVDESDFANTQQIVSKVPRKNKTTHTDTDTDAVDAGWFISFIVIFVSLLLLLLSMFFFNDPLKLFFSYSVLDIYFR